MAKNRIIQLCFAVATGLFINFIGWPGPHGGLQFLYESFWRSYSDADLWFQVIRLLLLSSFILGLISAFINNRRFRLTGTLISTIYPAIFFVFLLTRIYPPALPVVAMSSIPFLIGLIGSVYFAFLPKKVLFLKNQFNLNSKR